MEESTILDAVLGPSLKSSSLDFWVHFSLLTVLALFLLSNTLKNMRILAHLLVFLSRLQLVAAGPGRTSPTRANGTKSSGLRLHPAIETWTIILLVVWMVTVLYIGLQRLEAIARFTTASVLPFFIPGLPLILALNKFNISNGAALHESLTETESRWNFIVPLLVLVYSSTKWLRNRRKNILAYSSYTLLASIHFMLANAASNSDTSSAFASALNTVATEYMCPINLVTLGCVINIWYHHLRDAFDDNPLRESFFPFFLTGVAFIAFITQGRIPTSFDYTINLSGQNVTLRQAEAMAGALEPGMWGNMPLILLNLALVNFLYFQVFDFVPMILAVIAGGSHVVLTVKRRLAERGITALPISESTTNAFRKSTNAIDWDLGETSSFPKMTVLLISTFGLVVVMPKQKQNREYIALGYNAAITALAFGQRIVRLLGPPM